ncbi:A/G-specific adenine glycosylase [Hydrocarboniclastica marina]|uniref:Adenine DNA glycosylase n=1 Tax=Hydrocarboniclastica marina TaxID=2259620 RepID=A0A4P7XIH8_9ALTE|nr:A/G-specific adenine glycosylase [Hydrocarboniclastica marina]QCF26856.1 A/G-specific adenine glycosylase [Hydrocarboniclastica marina]
MNSYAERLLDWYDRNGRKALPWHRNRNAYRVWLSEIMLQQTQVATVIPYFERFTSRFPDVNALAQAPLDDVLQHWAGLGYYARARNLHRAAKLVAERHHGVFPDTLEALVDLPGIGRSTGGAILAQAYGKPAAILDGNVKRVLARYHAVEGWPGRSDVLNRLWRHAEEKTPRDVTAERMQAFTQASMDLGALVCTRRRPACLDCPHLGFCEAQLKGNPHDYPAPKPKKVMPEKAVWLLWLENSKGRLLLERRPPTGIWGGMWSLPEADADLDADDLPGYCQQTLGLSCGTPERLASFRHTFSHYHLDVQPVRLAVTSTTAVADTDNRDWLLPSDAVARGLPAPIRKVLMEPGLCLEA